MTKKFSIQIFSDIHIELWDKLPIIPIKAKYLFLAGDICQLNHLLFYPFLSFCSKNWEKVFYIPGNHEFYSNRKNYNELNFEYDLKIKEKYKNVFFLNDDFVCLDDDINIYGSTFWTIPPFDKTYQAQSINEDYNFISYFNKNKNMVVKWDISYVKELANNALNKLKDYLNVTSKKTIVMTHFPPLQTGTINPNYIDMKKTEIDYFGWRDNTIDKLNLKNVSIWISGHTHWSYDFEKNGIRFISNQIGYKLEIGTVGANEVGLFDIVIT